MQREKRERHRKGARLDGVWSSNWRSGCLAFAREHRWFPVIMGPLIQWEGSRKLLNQERRGGTLSAAISSTQDNTDSRRIEPAPNPANPRLKQKAQCAGWTAC
ncbi:hypothetical protein SDC9_167463 [bioreactor metagenome]|uniref:Uncharacterized protein n=1 Tax=bioreactor metagenome TaxID=1076179 RepID=A0A645G1P5_9ZZZZ